MKKFLLLILMLMMLLSLTGTAYCEGTLADLDAFEVFSHASKQDILRAVPGSYEVNPNFMFIDSVMIEDNLVILEATLDDNGFVSALVVYYDQTLLDYWGAEHTFENAMIGGTYFLGLDIESLVTIDGNEDSLYGFFPNGAVCVSSIPDDESYFVGCRYDVSYDEAEISSNGAAVNTGEVIITLQNTKMIDTDFQQNVLVAAFHVKNISDNEIAFSEISFLIKDSNDEALSMVFAGCPGNSISGMLAPGEEREGTLCYKSTGNSPYIISYQPNIFVDRVFVFPPVY